MAGIVILSPVTDHGKALIDKFERVSGERPISADHGTGDRVYYVGTGQTVESFEALLNGSDPDWREHVARSATDR